MHRGGWRGGSATIGILGKEKRHMYVRAEGLCDNRSTKLKRGTFSWNFDVAYVYLKESDKIMKMKKK